MGIKNTLDFKILVIRFLIHIVLWLERIGSNLNVRHLNTDTVKDGEEFIGRRDEELNKC